MLRAYARRFGAVGTEGYRAEMTETRAVTVCLVRGVYWHADAAQPTCGDSDHDHLRIDVHRHRDVVVMPDGTRITAVSFDVVDPYAREQTPDYGLYLDRQWAPSWPHEHVEWPDFGVPEDPAAVIEALSSLHRRARSGNHVELGCHGGHGRTGTALAALAVLCGQPAEQAIDWVRSTYCDQAIETVAQEEFIAELQSRLP